MASKAKAHNSKAGWLHKYEEAAPGSGTAASWVRYYAVLRGHDLLLLVNETKEEEPKETVDVEDGLLSSPDASKSPRRFAIDLTTKGGAGVQYHFCAENKEEHENWLQQLAVASVPDAWPGGTDFNKRPQPLLYSMWVVRHTGTAASVGPISAAEAEAGAKAGAGGARASDAKVPSPFLKLPLLKSAPNWQRKGLLLQKLRQCSIVFDGVDGARFVDDRETKRNTLLEIVDYADAHGRTAFQDARVLEDTFAMVRLNLFRTLPRSPPPSGDPDEDEETFSDPQWAHLNIVYELLLRLVSMDHIDITLKKRAVDPAFVRSLLTLFDSEDARERDYLKTITHRIYSKLTQRRALIRRVICNVFFEFVFETEEHRGIAEMLEILASIINGFAVPIKDEHKVMLSRALIPLHKSKAIAGYHPQLSYCMALYSSKDHTLTRDILPGMLKYWPISSSAKAIMFLNELEDIFEYVLEDDVAVFREALTLRLSKCIGGLHFQVCERTLLLWNSERFTALMLEHPAHRPAVLAGLFPALYENQNSHWHESIRTLSGHVLEQYAEVDGELVAKLKAEYEEKQAAREEAAAQAAAAAAAAAAKQALSPAASGGPAGAASTGMAGQAAGGGARMAPADRAGPTAIAATAGAASVISPTGRQGVPGAAAMDGYGASAAAAGSAASGSGGRAAGSGGGGGGQGVGAAAAGAGAVAASPGSGRLAGTGAHGVAGASGSAAGSPGHPGRAPAVRSSSSFPVSGPGIENADLLPHHRGDREGGHTPKRPGGMLGGHGMSMPLPIPSSGDAAGGMEATDE